MATSSVPIELPAELMQEIDNQVGSDHRSAFIIDTARAELRRRRLLAMLTQGEPIWSQRNHPERAERGSTEWVRQLRIQNETRVQTVESRADKA